MLTFFKLTAEEAAVDGDVDDDEGESDEAAAAADGVTTLEFMITEPG